MTTLGSSSLAGGSGGATYYHADTSHDHHGSPAKYHENGHDTFSDFVTLVCQEAQSTGSQVRSKKSCTYAPAFVKGMP